MTTATEEVTSLDSETAREELRRVLAEMRLPPTLYSNSEHPRDSATGRWLTQGEAELARRMANLQGVQGVVMPQGTTVRPSPNLAVLSRLLWLLDLSEGERAFVRAAAEAPCDLDGLAVFADWLEEQQRADAERFREVALGGMQRLNPQPGEVYVVRIPRFAGIVQDDFAVAYLRGLWEGISNGATLIQLAPDESLSMLTDEQLAAAGLVRKDGLASA
jgi:uncharacterized protein (TIGR02996 family)